MAEWAAYERLFNFREIKYFDIGNQITGVKSKAMTSPAARFASPSTRKARTSGPNPEPGLVQGEGIQHITTSGSLYATVNRAPSAMRLLDTPDTYELVDPAHP